MKNKLAVGMLLLVGLFFVACKRGDEVQRVISVTNITPGTTMIGGSTLNTAVIGDTITISGQGFSTVAAENLVSVQGIPAPVLAASPTTLQATVPAGVPFSYVNVVVARQGYQQAERRISVRSTPSPIIRGIRPAQGKVGTVVTIYGKHLLETVEANLMAFADASGRAARIYVHPINPVVATADSLQVTVPAGAGTGKIELYARPAQNVPDGFGSIVTPTFTVIP